MEEIRVGDWVTQYHAGYWKVREFHPRRSAFDYGDIHKGDPINDVAVLQKAFTKNFKFRMEMDSCDVYWIDPVNEAVKKKIEEYFSEHPDDLRKFETAQLPVPPGVTCLSLHIDEARQNLLSPLLDKELPHLTYPKVKKILSANGIDEVLTGAENTYLYLYGYDWEQDENADWIYSRYEFKKK